MAVTNYHTVNGRILGETTSGARTDYVLDALGSVRGTTNGSTFGNNYRFAAYGSLLLKTGSDPDPSFGWVGTLGYRRTTMPYADQYVRARHYGSVEGRWTSVDPLWLRGNPRTYHDPGHYEGSHGEAVGDIYMWARVEQPKRGRWQTVNPLWPLADAYAYSRLAPTTITDRLGLCPGGRSWSFYKWLYTGDGCATDEVYDAALNAGVDAASCYIDCVTDLNKQLATWLIGGALGTTVLIPPGKPDFLRELPRARKDSMWLRKVILWSRKIVWLRRLLQAEGRRLKRLIKDGKLPKALGRTAVTGVCVAEVSLAAICAFLCAQSDVLEEFQSDR